MSLTHTPRGTRAIRRQVVNDTLAEHPWSSARHVSNVVLAETGGGPTILTGALWIPEWVVYQDLCWLERHGRAERRQFNKRVIVWRALDA